MAALDERSYRRGLVLGLTMAEIMILVLFALLLIWMVGLRAVARSRSDTNALKAEVDHLQATIAELEDQKRAFLGSGSENAFDELFHELKLTKAELESAESQLRARDTVTETLTTLGYSFQDGKSAADSARDIQQRLRVAAAVLKTSRGRPDNRHASDEEIRDELASLASIEAALSAKGKSPSTGPVECAEALDRQNQCTTRLNTVEGRLANAQKQLTTVGRGTEKPACWADPQTGRPEYIFDVALKTTTVVIRDNKLPHRRVEQAALPVQSIAFDTELRQPDFRTQTRSLFQWSEKEGCRFFVRVFDMTAAHEKDAYKRQLRTVGEHFYYYEELSNAWGSR